VIPINNLPLKGLRNNNFIAKVGNQSATNDACLIVIVGLLDSFKMSICLLMGTDGHKIQREGIIIIDGKDFVNPMNLIDRGGRNGMTA
jgi:hypothetical protein